MVSIRGSFAEGELAIEVFGVVLKLRDWELRLAATAAAGLTWRKELNEAPEEGSLAIDRVICRENMIQRMCRG